MTSRRSALTVAVTVVFALSGCVIDRGVPTAVIKNQRATTISVTIEDTANDPTRGSEASGPVAIPPGQQYAMSTEDCLGTGAFATDDTGREIARLTQPLCTFDAWVFEADGTNHVNHD